MESGNDVMTFSDNANVVKFVKQPRKTNEKSPIKYKSLDWNDVDCGAELGVGAWGYWGYWWQVPSPLLHFLLI